MGEPVLITSAVQPKRKYKPKYGDILYEGAQFLTHILPEMHKPVENGYKIIRLPNIELHPLSALKKLNIKWIRHTMYDCPYTGYRHHGILPLAVITKDLSTYDAALASNRIHQSTREFILDFDFHWTMSHADEDKKPLHYFLRINRIEYILMGSCYTYGTSANDGMGRKHLAMIPLSNGDHLLCAVWVWYNK